MVIRQGDVFWVDLGEPSGSAPGYRHPHVVIVVCVITSNLKRATAPGNILLEKGEANLPKRSVVNVSQIFTVDKADLVEKIGALSPKRVCQILDGIRLLTESRDVE
jgi:mRNA interferase MazF